MRSWLAIAIVAVAAAAAGAGFYAWQSRPDFSRATEADIWSHSLRDVAGASQPLRQWRGKLVVINFWATWCEPCREEIPMFVRLQREFGARGLQFVGVAIDQPEKVRAFAEQFGMNYPLLVGGIEAAEWSRTLGNRAGALPYTLVIGRDGSVRMTHLGAIKESALLPYIHTLL